jgi:hypothetical protein
MNAAAKKPVMEMTELDSKLRDAVKDVMASEDVEAQNVAKVQELLDLKAALIRAPFLEKIRRIKESA